VLHWGSKVKTLSRSCVNFLTAIRKVRRKVNCFRFLRKILAQQAVRILVGSTFPRTVRIGEVHRRIQAVCNGFMVGEFSAIVKVIDFTACGKWRNIDKIAFRTVSDFLFGTCDIAKKRVLR